MGGRYDYVVNGNMIAGFALVAYPAKYGTSGVMTFMISHQGVLYEKNLGPRTAELVQSMTEFNPDKSWRQARRDWVELKEFAAGRQQTLTYAKPDNFQNQSPR